MVWSRFRYCSLRSYSSMVTVTVSWFRFLLLNIRVSIQGFQVITCICIFLILVLVHFHFGIISVPNQVEPKALVLEPKLTGSLPSQNFRYQNTKAAVLSVFLVLAQHY